MFSINDRHIAFVSGHDGASPVEVMLAFTLVPTSVMLRNLIVPWLFPATNFASNRLFDSWFVDVSFSCSNVLLFQQKVRTR